MNKNIITGAIVVGTIATVGAIEANNNKVDAASTYTTTSNLNLRASASTSSSRICLIPKGTKVVPLQYSNGWAKVSYGRYTGWCSAQYLSGSQVSNNTGNTNIAVKKGIVANRMIIINQCTMRLAYYENGKLVTTFSCATGKASTATPNGKFSILHKEDNRPYYKDHIPGGSPKNPLGYRFLQLTSSGYAIHGTNVPSSIGGKVSHGCVRLQNSNVEWLYDRVYVGTPVIIHSNPQGNKMVASQYGYYIG